MNEETKIYQFEDSEGNKVAPLVPEKAVVDKDGVRLSEKLEALNVNTIKEQINTAKEKAIEEVEASSENLTKNVGLDEYETFSEAKEYPAGYTLLKDGLLYTFITDHAAGAWDASQVEETSLKGDIDKLISQIKDNPNFGEETKQVVASYEEGKLISGSDGSITLNTAWRLYSIEGISGYDKINCNICISSSMDKNCGIAFF